MKTTLDLNEFIEQHGLNLLLKYTGLSINSVSTYLKAPKNGVIPYPYKDVIAYRMNDKNFDGIDKEVHPQALNMIVDEFGLEAVAEAMGETLKLTQRYCEPRQQYSLSANRRDLIIYKLTGA